MCMAMLALQKIFDRLAYPEIIQTDLGSEFKGYFEEYFHQHLGIDLRHPRRGNMPWVQGKVERSHAVSCMCELAAKL